MKNKLFTIHPSARPLFHLLILSILSFCILSSCNSTKQLQKNKTEIRTESTTTEKTTSHNQLISNTRIIESVDTSVLLKGNEIISSANLNSLISGDTIFANDSNLQLRTFYDSLTKTIKTQATVKPKTVLLKYQRITERQEMHISVFTSTKNEQQKQSIQSEKNAKEITRSSLPWWLIVIIIFTFFGIIVWAVLKLKRYL